MDEKITVYQKIFYSTGKYVILKNIFMFISGIIGIFVVRLLGPYEYGKYSLVWQLIGTVGPIVSLGWLMTLAKFIPEKNVVQKKSELFSQSIISVTIFMVVFWIGLIIFTYLWPNIIPVEIRYLKFVFMIFVGLVAFFNIFEGMYRGLGKFNEWTIIDGLRSNLASLLAIVLLLLGYRYYQTVIFSNFILAIIFAVGLLYYFRSFLIKPPKLLPENLIIKFSLTMILGQIVFLLGTSIDSILLRALLKDPAQVGFYNAGIRIPKMIEAMIIVPISVPFLYYFTHPDTAFSRVKILEFGSRMLGVIFAGVALLLFGLADWVVKILFGSDYLLTIPVLRIYTLDLGLIGFVTLFSAYFNSQNRPLVSIIAAGITFITVFILNLLLIPYWKSIAPAVGTVSGLIFHGIFLLFCLQEEKKIIIRNFVLLLFCLAVAVGIGFGIKFFLSLPVFMVMVLLMRLFTPTDISIWRRILRI